MTGSGFNHPLHLLHSYITFSSLPKYLDYTTMSAENATAPTSAEKIEDVPVPAGEAEKAETGDKRKADDAPAAEADEKK
jgi:hypothetical protein